MGREASSRARSCAVWAALPPEPPDRSAAGSVVVASWQRRYVPYPGGLPSRGFASHQFARGEGDVERFCSAGRGGGGRRGRAADVFVAAGSSGGLQWAQRAMWEALRSPAASDGSTSDVRVCLGPGTHRVGAGGVAFDVADTPNSAGRRVVWRGSGDETDPTIISGGVQVTGWQATTLAGGPAYAATLPEAARKLPAVRQLWVAGRRATRSTILTPGCSPTPRAGCTVNASSQCAFSFGANRSAYPGQAKEICPADLPICIGYASGHWGQCGGVAPNASFSLTPWIAGNKTHPTAVGFLAGEPLPESWAGAGPNTRAIELAWPVIVHDWIEPRCTVTSVVGSNITLSTLCALHLLATNPGPALPAPVRIEASPPDKTPLAPGEFWHDVEKGMLYYQLADGQTETQLNADAWVATEEAILTYTGASGHRWENVHFKHSTWLQVNSADGYVDNQATTYHCSGVPCGNCSGAPGGATCPMTNFGSAPGAVSITDGTDVTFHGCTFANIGSGYALSVMGQSKAVTVTSCSFTDLSGGFVTLKSGQDFSVTDNVATHMAIEYSGAPAYFSQFVLHTDISHNTIMDAGYTGISQGWGWGASHAANYGNVTISFNRIARVMTKMRDGGGIYLNGFTNPALGANVISNNWVDSDESEFSTYYFDNGASGWHLTQNVATNSPTSFAFFLTGANDPNATCVDGDAHDIKVDHLWYQNTDGPLNRCLRCGCASDDSTIFAVPAAGWLNSSSQCAFDYGTNRSAYPSQANEICPADTPTCIGYAPNKAWGQCGGGLPAAALAITKASGARAARGLMPCVTPR